MGARLKKLLIALLLTSLAACGSGGGSSKGTSSANTYINEPGISAEVMLDQPFDRNVSNYTGGVANDVTSFSFTPSLEDPNSQITINGMSVEPGRASPAVPLEVGENIITMVVTAADGSTQRTYTFVITRDAGLNANLAGLSLSTGSLDQTFSTNVNDYTSTVANSVSSVSVTPTAEESTSTIIVNGIPVNSGQASASIPLLVGSNAVSIVVTAEDNWTQKTYRLIITRSDTVVRSSDANLVGLDVPRASLDPTFTSGLTYYSAAVPNEVTALAVAPTASDEVNATILVDGTAVISGQSVNIPLNVGSNVITILVTAEDGYTQKNYTLAVTRQPRTNANLANLALSEVGMNPVFSSGVTSYSLSVGDAVTTLDVTPSLADSTASIKINGISVNTGVATSVSLSPGSNLIDVKVTAQDGLTVKNYLVSVTRTSTYNVDLASLTLSSGAMDQSFSAGTTSYSQSVDNTVSSLTLTPTVADSNSTVKVNGSAVTSGSASSSIALVEGANTIIVVVTGQDGMTTKTYTITVNRASAFASNADLSGLTTSDGTLSPIFAADTTAYSTSVASSVSSMTVTPTLADSNASVLVNGASAATAVNLNVGSNTINVVVTAEDGTTTKTYTITVTRQASTNTNLSALTVSTGALDQAFSSSITSYNQTVAFGITSLTVTPTVEDSDATVTVNNVSVTSGMASGAINLNVGANAINIKVTAGDGVSEKNYVVNVTREGNSDADLSSLVFSSGALTPSFSSATFSYTQSVPYATASLTVTPTLSDTNATSLKVEGMDVASGVASSAINLNVGSNVIDTVVVAQDGTTSQTYSVTVTRAAASTDADLSALTLSDGTLTPSFAAGTNSYSASVANGVASIDITGTANDSKYSAMTIDGVAATSGAAQSVSLVEGANPIDVVVTAEDGTTTNTYTVTVTRLPAGSSNADLSSLVPSSGSLDQTFQASSTAYTMTVGYVVSTMQVTPTLSDANASMTVNGQAVSNGALSQAIALTAGTTTDINVVVTAENTVTQKTYTITVTRESAGTFAQLAYVKASNTGSGDRFGYSMDISGDWMVVSALYEDGDVDSTGIPGGDNNNESDAGGVYVFKRTAGTWAQQAYLKPDALVINPTWKSLEAGDAFGWSVAMDGDTIVVGATGNDSGVTGVHYPSDGQSYEDAVAANGVSNAGAVFVFRDTSGSGAGTWELEALLKAHSLNAGLGFGRSIAISGDTVVVGAIGDDTSATDSGAAWVFKRTGTTWAQEAYLKASNPSKDDWFGMSVGIDGDTIAVGSPYEDTGATNAGAVYVYVRSGSTWSQQAMLKEATPYAEDRMGGGRATCGCDFIYEMVDVSGDTIAATVSLDNTAAAGAGAVAVFVRSGTTWSQQALLVGAEATFDQLGSGVGLDGDTLVIGAAQADGDNTGINSTANTNASASGAAWVFTRSGTTWTQQYYIKTDNPTAVDNFGVRCDVNQGTVACSANLEDGSATGINGVDDNAATSAGAVYIFE